MVEVSWGGGDGGSIGAVLGCPQLSSMLLRIFKVRAREGLLCMCVCLYV